MRLPLDAKDIRTAGIGLGVALVSGLLMGAGLRPHVSEFEVQGPQMLMGSGGVRGEPLTVAAADWTRYGGRVPDYVIGTDALRPPPAAQAAETPPSAEDEPATSDASDDAADAPLRARTEWRDPPQTPSRYPSLDGDEPVLPFDGR